MFKDLRILLTGASQGIGRETAMALAERGARVTLVARSAEALGELAHDIVQAGGQAYPLAADLTDPAARARVVDDAITWMGGLDMIVNVAGTSSFGPFEAETPEALETLVTLNLLAPMQLCRDAVERFTAQGHGHVVNAGSVFGSIGFPHFAAYSATKFGVRGFCQALRRELAGTGIDVTHVAPRATRTAQTGAYADMVEATKMHLDEPAVVAARIVQAIERREKDVVVGGPEGVFVRLNNWFPRLVDRLMRKQTETARPFAEAAASRRALAAGTPRVVPGGVGPDTDDDASIPVTRTAAAGGVR